MYLLKKASVGNLLGRHIDPDELDKNIPSKELNRMIRKHPKQALPQTKMDFEIAKGVENLRKKVPNITYRQSPRSTVTHGAGYGWFESPSSHSTTAGHEVQHVVDNKESIKVRATNRSSAKAMLPLEASATKGITDQLSKSTQRGRGAHLANSYDTYDWGARQAAPDKGVRAAQSVERRLMEGFKGKWTAPSKIIFNKTEEMGLLRRATSSMIRRKTSPQTMGKIWARTAKYRKIFTRKDKENMRGTLQRNNEVSAHNRKTLIKNLAEAPAVYNSTIKSETLRHIKETRKTFGPSVARGVIDQIRGIRDEVNTLKHQNKKSTKVKNFFTGVFNKVKGLK